MAELIYADNDVVSGFGKRDFPPPEMKALEVVEDLHSSGRLNLRTSLLALREIEDYQDDQRRGAVEAVYRRLEKIPFVEDHKLLGFHSQWDSQGGITYPLLEDDPISLALRGMGIKRTDAHHVMLAIRSGCDVFLTCDGGVLEHRAEIENRFSIRPMRPSDLVERFSGPH